MNCKEATGSSVGVFVSHVELNSEAARKGLKIGDQLLQVNGLNVNQATYEEVIDLIKQTPKFHDILLKVNNFGKIPFQEKCGDSIKWLQVLDLIDLNDTELSEASAGGFYNEEEDSKYERVEEKHDGESDKLIDCLPDKGTKTTGAKANIKISSHSNTTNGKQTSTSLSSDEGIESCESQRAISLSSESENESSSRNALQVTSKYQDIDSAVSSTLTLSNDESCSCSSACSISISSVQTTASSCDESEQQQLQPATQKQAKYESADLKDEDAEIVVQVPGGRQTSEPFGCGVVKGPKEWPGIFVQNVKPGSLAQRVGLEAGDELTRADDQLLTELSFDDAIGLIKHLQQQQDQLRLHVRKGAALKHLSENRLRNQVNYKPSGDVGKQTQKETSSSSTCGNEEDADSVNKVSQTLSSESNEGCRMQGTTEKSTCNAISDTQNQLSAKQQLGASRQQVVVCGDLKADSRQALSIDESKTTILIGSNTKQRFLSKAEQSNVNEVNQRLGTSQPHSSKSIGRGAQIINNSGGASKKEMKTQQQPNIIQAVPFCKPRYDFNGNVSEPSDTNDLEGKSFRKDYEFCRNNNSFERDHQTSKINYKNSDQDNGAESGHEEPQDEDGDENENEDEDEVEDEDEEIRIVSQNCKLHHQSFHNNYSKLNLVKKKFPQHSDKLLKGNNNKMDDSRDVTRQMETKSRDNNLGRKLQLNQTTLKKRQPVDEIRRQLECNSSRPLMHRYVSFENLASSQRQVACLSQQQHLLRSPATAIRQRRSDAEENEGASNEFMAYKQQPMQVEQRNLSKQRLYSRSSSVLSHNAGTCCTQARPPFLDLASQGSKTMRCIQQQQQQCGMFPPMLRQQSQCCLQQTQQQQQLYGSSLNTPLALSRSKARSMDKLNMNLNYVSIGQSHYKVSRQAMVGGAKSCAGALISSTKQQRRLLTIKNAHPAINGDDQLLCCSPNTMRPLACLAASAQVPLYNYSTGSRLVSTVSSGSPASQNRMRRLQAACCSSLFSECSSSPVCPSSACSNRQLVDKQKHRKTCCSPIGPKVIYAKCSTPLLMENFNNKRSTTNSYSCCSSSSSTLTCCPKLRSSTVHKADPSSGCTSRREPTGGTRSKYVDSSKGTTTDSSGYLSSGERYNAPRLLKLCPMLASPPQPPTPPPPPKLVNSSNKLQQHHSCAGTGSQQRDTRQRLSTFLSATTCQSGPMNQRRPQNSSDNSPTCSSSYSPSTSITSSSQSDSSLHSVEQPLRSASPAAPLSKQQSQANQRSRCVTSSSSSSSSATRHIPCPPPMPAPDAEFECKLSNILRQQEAKVSELNCNNDKLLQARQARKQEALNKNRLCFVDELKMLARRQQQVSCSSSLSSTAVDLSFGESSTLDSPSSSSNDSAIDSSTLIKIINATKSSNAARAKSKRCSCQAAGQARNRQLEMEMEMENNNGIECDHKCSTSGGNEHANNQENQLRCNQNNNLRSSQPNQKRKPSSKSVKLDDEHNKRRQHEMLMKEFKSAHSRMFKRRNANPEEISNENNQLSDKQQQNDQPRTVTASKTSVQMLPQPPVRLAAAN